MKVIIAGSRGIQDYAMVAACLRDACSKGLRIAEVVSGTARGVDQLGEQWADENNIPTNRFPADWGRLGSAAGCRRNEEMAEYADALVALWDGKSRGTKHMIDIAQRQGMPVFIYNVRGRYVEPITKGRIF